MATETEAQRKKREAEEKAQQALGLGNRMSKGVATAERAALGTYDKLGDADPNSSAGLTPSTTIPGAVVSADGNTLYGKNSPVAQASAAVPGDPLTNTEVAQGSANSYRDKVGVEVGKDKNGKPVMAYVPEDQAGKIYATRDAQAAAKAEQESKVADALERGRVARAEKYVSQFLGGDGISLAAKNAYTKSLAENKRNGVPEVQAIQAATQAAREQHFSKTESVARAKAWEDDRLNKEQGQRDYEAAQRASAMQGANMRVARAAARAAERNGRPLDPAYLGTASQNYETAKAVAGVPLTKYVERRNRGRVNPYSRKPGSY